MVSRHLARGGSAYGVTTGLGYLTSAAVSDTDQAALQRSLVTARASGLGAPLPADVVRGAMTLRLNGFLSGHAGVTPELCRFIAAREHHQVLGARLRAGARKRAVEQRDSVTGIDPWSRSRYAMIAPRKQKNARRSARDTNVVRRATKIPRLMKPTRSNVNPGMTTMNGTNIFGKEPMIGVLRAADIDLVAIARCTSTKLVVQ